MNINNFFNKKNDKEKDKFVSSTKRAVAISIDIWIVLFLRAAFVQIVGITFLNDALIEFGNEFVLKFGTETIKRTPEHINFLTHHKVFYYSLFLYAFLILIGAVYHAYLNSSAWRGTIGKRIMKILILKSDESSLSFWGAMAHYFASLVPFIFIIYLISYQMANQLTLAQAITSSKINLFLTLSLAVWTQIQIFTKKKTTTHDLICDAVLINGKTEAKTPWQKDYHSSY